MNRSNGQPCHDVPSPEQHTLFDPAGVFWRVNREMVLMLGGGAALLSQIAHPLVAAGVYEHSGFREQPLRRLYGTITAMQRMIYGPRPIALAAAARIRQIHRNIHGRLTVDTAAFPRGTRYDARDPELLLWVHATLVATALRTYETFFPPLSPVEREEYYRESKIIGQLVGLEFHQLPAGWDAFVTYYHSMLTQDVLEVTPVTRELARHILYPPVSWIPHLAGDVLSVATVALLPAPLDKRYALRRSKRRDQAWTLASRTIRRTLPHLPALVRTRPGVWRMERRLRGGRGGQRLRSLPGEDDFHAGPAGSRSDQNSSAPENQASGQPDSASASALLSLRTSSGLDIKSNMTDRYDPAAVEDKWQAEWEKQGTNAFSAETLHTAARPFYNLMMFPYPSAEGLHIGNIYAFTGADVHGRYWRLRGDTVFEPMGFDAFGIHSENYALKVGTNPNELIPRNIANFTRQLRRIGGMFDWNHVVDTTRPEYYRWTQWIFLKLHEAGLVERREAPVNWCPSCMTVLANEQVIAGLCERCDSQVEQRLLPQWFFKISQYAERLLDNLEHLDWSEITRKAQANWIGRSEGAEIEFAVAGSETPLRVFTTRPDTLFGATYMVLAPEHPLVDAVTAAEKRAAVNEYRAAVAHRDLIERRKTDKAKTGVFTGGHCTNPANGEKIPIWIADYVLMDYGTGAIMAVPGHDERDFEFARAFDLPIVRVIAAAQEDAATPLAEAYDGDGRLVNSGAFDSLSVPDGKRAIIDWLTERGAAEAKVNYRLHDWCVSRQRYWGPPIPMVHCDACGPVPVNEAELPVLLPYVENFAPDDSGVSPLARDPNWLQTTCPACGEPARRETDVSDTFLDSAWYFLRYPSTDRDDVAFDAELTRMWLPVDCYIGGNEHAVLHLMYARFVTMALHDLGLLEFEEPFKRFRAHGLIINEGAKMSKSRGNVVVADQIIEEYGADTLRLYLMFLGPFEQGGDYRGGGIEGAHGFLRRLWQTVREAGDGPTDAEVERKLHQTIRQVTEQIPGLHYNTAVAAMMEYLNVVRAGGRTPRRAEVEPLVVLVAPFAPHVAEELWHHLGHTGGIFAGAHWPGYDAEKAREPEREIAVQVNGKVRGRVTVAADATESAVLEAALANDNVARYTQNKHIRNRKYVPGRVLNLVVG
jgi:leucyl-tRNA synthetase